MKKKKILIVDDEEMSRELLKQMFQDDFDILEARDGKEAIYQVFTHESELAVIFLDLVMPELNGFQVLQVLMAKHAAENVPIVMITAQNDTKTEMTCYSLGASAVINKPYEAKSVIMQVRSMLELYNRADDLETQAQKYKHELGENKKKLDVFCDKLIDVVANIVEFRSIESKEHTYRIREMTKIMCNTYQVLYPDAGLTKAMTQMVIRASALHDVGMIVIPDAIVQKPGALTADERELMKSHTTRGCELLQMMTELQDEKQYEISRQVCRYHHEKYDGSGYPEGLSGEKIPLSAQLVSIVDCFDALCSDRVYKEAVEPRRAYEMIMAGECGAFSPKMKECFTKALDSLKVFFE